MKTTMIKTLASVWMLALVTGCGEKNSPQAENGTQSQPEGEAVTMDDVQEETSEAVASALALADQTKDDYMEKVKSELEDVNKRMEEIKAKADKLGDDVAKGWEEKLSELKDKQKALKEKTDQVKDASADAWRDLAEGMKEARETLAKALENAESDMEQATD